MSWGGNASRMHSLKFGLQVKNALNSQSECVAKTSIQVKRYITQNTTDKTIDNKFLIPKTNNVKALTDGQLSKLFKKYPRYAQFIKENGDYYLKKFVTNRPVWKELENKYIYGKINKPKSLNYRKLQNVVEKSPKYARYLRDESLSYLSKVFEENSTIKGSLNLKPGEKLFDKFSLKSLSENYPKLAAYIEEKKFTCSKQIISAYVSNQSLVKEKQPQNHPSLIELKTKTPEIFLRSPVLIKPGKSNYLPNIIANQLNVSSANIELPQNNHEVIDVPKESQAKTKKFFDLSFKYSQLIKSQGSNYFKKYIGSRNSVEEEESKQNATMLRKKNPMRYLNNMEFQKNKTYLKNGSSYVHRTLSSKASEDATKAIEPNDENKMWISSQVRKIMDKYPEYVDYLKEGGSAYIKKYMVDKPAVKDVPTTLITLEEAIKEPVVSSSYFSKVFNKNQLDDFKEGSNNGTNGSTAVDFQSAFNSFIPQLLRQRSKVDPKVNDIPQWMEQSSTKITKASIDQRTRHLTKSIGMHLTDAGKLRRLENLVKHLTLYPEAKGVAVKSDGIQRVVQIQKLSKDPFVHEEARECLALLGYVPPTIGPGLRLLSIDGGGIRGLVALELLRSLEDKMGEPIHKMFDYIGGVSSGAILALLLGAHKLSIDECEHMYRKLGTRVFSQTTFKGATSMMWNHSYYNSDNWDKILKETVGETSFMSTNREKEVPKLCVVATQASHLGVKPFLFRNYELPYRVASHYVGTSSYHLWEAARASAAAPGYFSEFKLDNRLLLDGGVLVNNPTAILLHEAKQLWPNANIQSLISIGTGRHEPIETKKISSINWSTLFRALLCSATDTEGVHTMLHDLLPGSVYYRFNPYLCDEFSLDDIREDRIDLMMEDTNLYIRKNDQKIAEAVYSLSKPKNKVREAKDWMDCRSQLWAHY